MAISIDQSHRSHQCSIAIPRHGILYRLFEAIRYFQQHGKIFIVHFRHVSAPLPEFVETFLDDGYMDMYEVMKVFCEVDYDGTMILDHTPKMVNDPDDWAGTAYAIGYMRALRERAEAELGKA